MISELSRFRGCLLGIAIGDALGTPYEMKSRSEILQMTNGKGVVGFDPTISRKRSDGLELLTSDDFGLTEAVGWSLIRRNGFDIVDIALSHVEMLEQIGTDGWGSTTRNGILEIKEYFDSRGKKGRSPFDMPKIVEGKGCGNGIAMKCAPIALALEGKNSISIKNLNKFYADLGRLTHFDSRSWTAAVAIATIINHIKKCKEINDWFLLDLVRECALFEKTYTSRASEKQFSSCLKLLLDKEFLCGPIENLAQIIGTSSLATESVVFAIAVFLRNKDNFKNGLLEAVNFSLDADSVCSMVGAMLGYLLGEESVPEEWKNYSKEFDKSIILADKLYEIFQ